MKRSEWIACVAADMYTEYDLRNPSNSAIMLAIRWWRMMHPLEWQTDWESEGIILFPPSLAGMTFDEAVVATQDIPEVLF